jgi:hypothetical protein
MGTRVVAVDIGSVPPPSKFAWAAFDAPGRDLIKAGDDPRTAVSMLAPGLMAGAQAALLLEAPMAVPVSGSKPDAWRGLRKARDGGQQAMAGGSRGRGAGNRAGAGGLDASPTRRHRGRGDGDDTARILATRRRAAIAGRGVHYRGRQARAIARRPACHRCRSGWTRTGGAPGQPRDSDLGVCCSPQQSFNLLTAMAQWAELRIDPGELRADVFVVATRPQPKAVVSHT